MKASVAEPKDSDMPTVNKSFLRQLMDRRLEPLDLKRPFIRKTVVCHQRLHLQHNDTFGSKGPSAVACGKSAIREKPIGIVPVGLNDERISYVRIVVRR